MPVMNDRTYLLQQIARIRRLVAYLTDQRTREALLALCAEYEEQAARLAAVEEQNSQPRPIPGDRT